MKRKTIIIAVLCAIALQGCIVKSLHPFYKPSDVLFKNELVATWADQNNDKWRIARVEGKATGYELHWLGKGNRDVAFSAQLFLLNGDYYMDFFPLDDHASEEQLSIFNLHLLPTHSIARVDIASNERIQIKWFNEKWLNAMFEQNRIKISHEVVKDEKGDDASYVLTASTEELQKFITKYGNMDEAFDNNDTMWLRLDRTIP